MRTALLALLACQTSATTQQAVQPPEAPGGVALASVAAPAIATRPARAKPTPPMPPTPDLRGMPALVQRDCYGGSRDEGAMPPPAPTSTGRSASRAPAPPPSASPGGALPAAPVADAVGAGGLGMSGTGIGGGGSAEGLGGLGTKGMGSGSSGYGSGGATLGSNAVEDKGPAAKKSKDAPPPAKPAAAEPMAELSRGDAAEREMGPPGKMAAPAGPTLDWGATVYLSNDDSMSLASAQRLLWTMDQGRTPSPSEVRPHELLNYFSFDTAPVAEGELFSVLGSAAVDGDTLQLALAVQGALPPRQPLDLSLVIDRSGSMSAEGRMAYVRRGMLKMVDQLAPGDRVDLVLFDSVVCTPLENFVVGRDDPALLRSELARMEPRGSTDLDGGLREGLRVQRGRESADRNRRILLLTDAQLNTGNVNMDLVSEVGRAYESDGVRLTGVGVGRDFNDTMLNKLTEKGKGAYVYLGSESVVDRVFGASFSSLVQTIAHDVQFSVELPQSLAMERFYGEESSTVAADVQPIHYYAGTSQVFLQDLKVRDGRANPSDPLRFTVRYTDARTGAQASRTFSATVGELLAGDPRNLRKAQALMRWTDLVAAAALGDRSCGALPAYRSAAAQVGDDAEIGYVSGLTGRMCGVDLSQPMPAAVALKVTLDADQTIPEVGLSCPGGQWTQALSGSDKVARFPSVLPGDCRLTLQGAVPMTVAVTVPSTGADLRCLLRGGRVSCG